MRALIFAAVAILATLPCIGYGAKIYKWTDEKGQDHFTSTPPPSAAGKTEQIGDTQGGSAFSYRPTSDDGGLRDGELDMLKETRQREENLRKQRERAERQRQAERSRAAQDPDRCARARQSVEGYQNELRQGCAPRRCERLRQRRRDSEEEARRYCARRSR
jgi:hypothetical protein